MIWLDLLAVAIILGAVFAESKRAFGATLFDMVAILAAVKLAKLAGPALANMATVLAAPDDNEALAITLMFMVFAGSLLTLSHFLQEAALLTLDGLDDIVGPIFGLVSGVAVAHIVLVAIITANPAATDATLRSGDTSLRSTSWGAAARKRLAVREVVEFRTYHYVVHQMRHFGEG